jgi:hypothetical protein
MRTKALQIAFLATVLAAAIPSTMSAATIYTATLLGSNEVPPTGSTATGSITVTLTGDVLAVSEVFSGLTASASAAHIHCCGPIGVNEPVAVPFTGFPSATSGTYMNSFDLTLASTYTAAFLTANGGTPASAEAAFIAGLNTFQTYANIHDTIFPGGEIRGQLAQVPEPATVGLVLLAWAVFGLASAKHRSRHRLLH